MTYQLLNFILSWILAYVDMYHYVTQAILFSCASLFFP